MNKLKLAALTLAATVALAGCASTIKTTNKPSVAAPSQGVNHPSDTATSDTPTPTPSPTQAGPKKFGQRYTYDNGLVVTVAAPVAFTPGEYASKDPAAAYVILQFTVINGTGKNYDPSVFQATVQSANVEASTVYDTEANLGGSPQTMILPRRESTFKMAFGVRNPKDLVVQVTPSFDYDPAIFTS
jgi:hypothetical protein